jgi:outer membrane protein
MTFIILFGIGQKCPVAGSKSPLKFYNYLIFRYLYLWHRACSANSQKAKNFSIMKKWYVVWVVIWAWGGLQAQTRTISLEEAIQVALQENISLKVQQNNLEVRQMEKTQAMARFMPTVSAFAQVRRQSGIQFIPQEVRLVNTVTEDFFPSLDANLTLFGGFRNTRNLQASRAAWQAQEDFVERSKQEVMFNVAFQYLTILLDQELVRIARENIETQQKQLVRVKGFVETGATFIGDQYNLESQIKNLELEEVRAINRLENDKTALARMLLLDPLTQFSVVAPNWDVAENLTDLPPLSELYTLALQNRKDLSQQKMLELATQYQYQMARGNYLPTLSAYFSYSSYYNSTARAFDPNGFPTDQKVSFQEQIFERNPNRTVGLRLEVPIFNQFQARTQVARARVEHENALLNAKDTENVIFSELQTSWQDFEAAKASFEAAQAQFKAAKLGAETQQQRFDLGLATIIELTTANNTFVRASVDQAQALYTLLFQRILLDYYVGVLQPDMFAK